MAMDRAGLDAAVTFSAKISDEVGAAAAATGGGSALGPEAATMSLKD